MKASAPPWKLVGKPEGSKFPLIISGTDFFWAWTFLVGIKIKKDISTIPGESMSLHYDMQVTFNKT